MKVLFVAPQPFFRIRGTPINVRNVVTALAEAGHEVDLLCYPFGDELEIPGVNILRCRSFIGVHDVGVGPSLAKFPLDFMLFLKAFVLCTNNKYSVIHAVEESVFFAVWLKRITRCKLIYDMDSCISDQLKYSGFVRFPPLLWFVSWMERRAMKASVFVLTVCEALSEHVRRLSPETRIVQIEDAPMSETFVSDEAKALELRQRFGIAYDQPVVVYTGNFETYQGIDLLVDAVEMLQKQAPEIVFLLVGGSDADQERIKSSVITKQLEGQVILAGRQPIEDMEAYMTLADVLVSPRIEGANTALKIYGYMQSGKPIVATRLATHTQVLDEGCAVLVEPDAEHLAKGLLFAVQEPLMVHPKGRAAQQRVNEKYSLPQFFRKIGEAYDSLTP